MRDLLKLIKFFLTAVIRTVDINNNYFSILLK